MAQVRVSVDPHISLGNDKQTNKQALPVETLMLNFQKLSRDLNSGACWLSGLPPPKAPSPHQKRSHCAGRVPENPGLPDLPSLRSLTRAGKLPCPSQFQSQAEERSGASPAVLFLAPLPGAARIPGRAGATAPRRG